ncbi:MocR-like pyridoxine biosynthesis transcription factor PdxR [Phytohabitans aurantiacus]|uniref:GntR family transcriptional regulator n=1 Tax=Phytohabitans aurantiacus TaxID=3016789 RepID=A0ABQ5R6K0_9ACTN|nr:PLP-dependent aminotransferase family protein [Phytohabitans aurantiacus]GLI02384.1 GntR family transcriptional regulator [Phytohabitans aurantiacus]
MPRNWATFGGDLHLDLGGGSRRAGLERALRDAIRAGRLTPATRLPSTRALAAELGLARNTVSAAYDQLVAEGYLAARHGSGTVVAGLPPAPRPASSKTEPEGAAPRYDLRPGSPDVSTFPTTAWLRSLRRALATAPASRYDYDTPAGTHELRTVLSEYLGRARGVLASPDRIVVTSGYVQALALLAGLVDGPIATEDPGLAFHRELIRRHGHGVLPIPVDEHGVRTDLLSTRERAVLVTPAHQYPTGATLAPDRRHALTEWAAATDGLIIEDDYDGEFRYDRQPVGALQGMAPDRVVYVGTASKTLGPALRLAWMVLPAHLVEPVTEAKRYADAHTESLGQLALADLIATHGYDRHVRACRLRYRRRRDLLVARLGRRHPLGGIAAGLHAMITLPAGGPTESEVLATAADRGLAVGELGSHWHTAGTGAGERPQGIIVGYGTPPERGYLAALDTLARVLRGG